MAKGLDDAGILYRPQHQVTAEGHRYTLDFLVTTSAGPHLAIECDGLQFHARPGNYARDRKRDRILQRNGYQVLRFASVEIFQDVVACVAEIDRAFWQIQRARFSGLLPARRHVFDNDE